MIEFKPGEITDPNWSGPRCGVCARPVGGDGSMWSTCADVPQVCLTMEMVPHEKRSKFFEEKIWDNAYRMLGWKDAVDWFAAGRLAMVRDGQYRRVLDEQFDTWPQLVKEIEQMRKLAA